MVKLLLLSAADDGNYIEACFALPVLGFEVGLRCRKQQSLLAGIHGFFGPAVPVGGAGFHLYKYQYLLLLGNYVDLGPAVAEIHGPDSIAFTFEKAAGSFFGRFAVGYVSGHGWKAVLNDLSLYDIGLLVYL